ncbi:MAG TPA: hypothetical protein VNH17_03910 [Streptosporangiaceae bacterium]|nr:hypothetical protein [Streptosporangiaceae bacterium]
MNWGDRYFEQKIRAWVAAEILDRSQQLANGLAADYADYRNRVGYLSALGDILQTMQTTERDMSAAPDRQERT